MPYLFGRAIFFGGGLEGSIFGFSLGTGFGFGGRVTHLPLPTRTWLPGHHA
jgi:hypothetical protein